ncbi:hypothetical protein K7432_005448 [Basidiobolus ranarum]|uniref:GIY-YIG domain-containing protein n=1 Tax=Basidiobolus ranarum TaxID=34480 RepID=A0ABR2WWG9_9FUNG
MLCVYILENLTGTTRTYVGFTVDLRRRLRKHNREIVGGARATEGRLWKPFLVVTGFHTKKCGLQLEWRIKHPPRTWSQSRSTSKVSGRRRRRKNNSKSIIYPKSLFPQAKPSNIYKEKFVKVSCAKLSKKLYLAHAVCAILHLEKWTTNAIPLAEQGNIVLHWDEIDDLKSIKAPWPESIEHKQFDWANFITQPSTRVKKDTSKDSIQTSDTPSQEFVLNMRIDQDINTQSDDIPPNPEDSSFASPCTDSSASPLTPYNQDHSQITPESPLQAKSKSFLSELTQPLPSPEIPLFGLRRSPRIKRLNERLLDEARL